MEYRPYHFWAIHRDVVRYSWGKLHPRQRDIITFDVDHTTETFQRFDEGVKAETERRFQDPEYYANAAHTFRIGYEYDVAQSRVW